MSRSSSKPKIKRLLAIGGFLILIIGLTVAYVLVRQNQDVSSQAALQSRNPYCNLPCKTNANCFNGRFVCLKDGKTDKGVCRLRSNPTDPACRSYTCQVDAQGNSICPEFAQVMCPPGQVTVPQPNDACGCSRPPTCTDPEDELSSVQLPWLTSPEPSRSVVFFQTDDQFTIESMLPVIATIYQSVSLASFQSLSTSVTEGLGEVGIQMQLSNTFVKLRTWPTEGKSSSTNIGLWYQDSTGADREVAMVKGKFNLPMRLTLEKNSDNSVSAFFAPASRPRRQVGTTPILGGGNYSAGIFAYSGDDSKGTFRGTVLTARTDAE